MPRRPAAESPRPVTIAFFFALDFCMSSICFIPGPRMLYATQPRTGTNAPKMMMRASSPAVCISSVAASACSGMPRSAAAESPNPRGAAFFSFKFFTCISLSWFIPGPRMLYATHPRAGPRITRNTSARLSNPATSAISMVDADACCAPKDSAPARVRAAVCVLMERRQMDGGKKLVIGRVVCLVRGGFR